MDTSLLPDRPWWKLWGSDSGEARRPHAPGVWLIYFTIASLPMFGLGQWLVPAVEEDRRAWLFLYFLAYISSGMGLLLATSFLNLRRYLRRRKLKMPAAMTATWLSTGAILIVGLTLAAAVLPLPLSADAGGARLARESSDLRASKYAVLKDSGVQGEGARSEGPAASKSGEQATVVGQGQGLGEDQRSQRRPADQRPGETGRRGRPGTFQVRRTEGQARRRRRTASRASRGRRRISPATRAKGRDQSGRSSQGPGRAKDEAERGSKPSRTPSKGEKKGSEQDDEKSSEENPDQGDSSSQAPKLPSLSFPAWTGCRRRS